MWMVRVFLYMLDVFECVWIHSHNIYWFFERDSFHVLWCCISDWIRYNTIHFSSVQFNGMLSLHGSRHGNEEKKNAETLAANWLISCDFLTISVHSFHSTLDYVPVPLTSRQRPLNIWMGQFDYIQFISFAYPAHFPNTHQTNAAYFFPLFLSQHRDLFFSSSIFKWFEIEKNNFKLIDLFSAKRKSNRLPWKNALRLTQASIAWLTDWLTKCRLIWARNRSS